MSSSVRKTTPARRVSQIRRWQPCSGSGSVVKAIESPLFWPGRSFSPSSGATRPVSALRVAQVLLGGRPAGHHRVGHAVVEAPERELSQHALVLAGGVQQPAHGVAGEGRRRRRDADLRAGQGQLQQVVLQARLVLDVALALSLLDLEERGLRDVEEAALDQPLHLPVEEGQQEES